MPAIDKTYPGSSTASAPLGDLAAVTPTDIVAGW